MMRSDAENQAMDASLKKTFIDEAREHLELLGAALLGLDSVQTDGVLLNRIFRNIHTIKGSSRSVGFATIGRVAHAAEDVLAALREGKLSLHPDITDALLTSADLLIILVNNAEAEKASTSEDEKFIDSVCTRLHKLLELGVGHPAPPAPPADQGFGLFSDDEPVKPGLGKPPSGPDVPVKEVQVDASDNRSLRVAQKKLDMGINLAGELIVATNALQHHFKAMAKEPAVLSDMKSAIALVCRLTSDLHRNAMGMRFIPMRTVLQNVPRIVRDVARAQNKLINATISGEYTEVDRQVAEALADPLMHLIRNAADHGIESSQQRLAQGKAEAGQIAISASREANCVVIDIIDDGGGIDTKRLKAKALEAKIIGPLEADQMSDQELLQLIFVPGLSTATKVTDISGRGVGMDVVKSTISRLGGEVKVKSEITKGTQIRIQLPFTLAVTNAVFVVAQGVTYALPVDAVVETVNVPQASVHRVSHQMAINLRGQMCVVAPLGSLLIGTKASLHAGAGESVRVVIMRTNGETFGIAVDQVKGQREMIVKPVPSDLVCAKSVAGATILDDGQIALLLDPVGLYGQLGQFNAA